MALSEAKKAADKRYMDKLDNIMIRPRKKEGDAIRTAAAAAGMSVQAYVLRAVRAWMEQEQAEVIPADTSPAASPAVEDGPGVDKVSVGASQNRDIYGRSSSLTDPDYSTGQPPQTVEEWAAWSCRGENETVTDWRVRLKRSISQLGIGEVAKRLSAMPKSERDLFEGGVDTTPPDSTTGLVPAPKQESLADVAKRLSAMTPEERDKAMGCDDESMERYQERMEYKRKRLAELTAKAGGLSRAEEMERRRLLGECQDHL